MLWERRKASQTKPLLVLACPRTRRNDPSPQASSLPQLSSNPSVRQAVASLGARSGPCAPRKSCLGTTLWVQPLVLRSYSPPHLPAFFFSLPPTPAHKTHKIRIKTLAKGNNRRSPVYSRRPCHLASRMAPIRARSRHATHFLKITNRRQDPRSARLHQIVLRCGLPRPRRFPQA